MLTGGRSKPGAIGAVLSRTLTGGWVGAFVWRNSCGEHPVQIRAKRINRCYRSSLPERLLPVKRI